MENVDIGPRSTGLFISSTILNTKSLSKIFVGVEDNLCLNMSWY